MHRFVDCLLASSQRTCVKYTWSCTYVLHTWWWTERPSETCSVIFDKLRKIVHLVGFTKEICYDARSHKRRMYLASSQRTYMTYTWSCMYVLHSWWWTERPSETSNVIFNEFRKIVHLVAFTKEIYYDARTHERRTYLCWSVAIFPCCLSCIEVRITD